MAEVTVVMCDGPTCTVQQDKPPLGTDDWISLHDWSKRPSQTHHFCSWACLARFSDMKLTDV